MITDRDRQILDFVDEFGCITIKQAELMYFSNSNFGYDLARKRLNYLTKIDWLRHYKDTATNLKVYYTNRKYSYHRIILLDYYAKLINNGVEISFFKPDYEWMGGKVISDAFAGFIFNGKPYFNLVEVITNRNDMNIGKYDELFESTEPQKLCVGQFPIVTLIDNIDRKKEIKLNHVNVVNLNYQMNDIAKVFLK